MANHLKIGGVDFSAYVAHRGLKVTRAHNYNAQTNAAGNTVIDYINAKRALEVEFVSMNGANMAALLTALESLAVTVQYRDPKSGVLETMQAIAPKVEPKYNTLSNGRVLFEPLAVKFTEL